MLLASYASDPASTRGRRFQEPQEFQTSTRTAFQRDRDRVVHSSAFRRLVYKTQVFLNHEGDLFRTRMTHSLEVAQLSRSMARALRLNEDLVEAIALAHDLGHTPFGHAGQDALNTCMCVFGGFEHNLQSLRVVDHLELRYPQFDGLNLSFEAREGILKHCAPSSAMQIEQEELAHGADPQRGGIAHRFLARNKPSQPSLEAQLCNLADEMAYNAHDIDDGVRSGLLTLQQLEEVPMFEHFRLQTLAQYPHLNAPQQQRRLLYESIRRMLSSQVHAVIDTTREALHRLDTQYPNLDAMQVRKQPVQVQFGEAMARGSRQLKQFLMRNLYRHPQVVETTAQAKKIVADLFAAYLHDPAQMPSEFAASRLASVGAPDLHPQQRVVADYIAGMTDRMASREHERLTGLRLLA